MRKTLLWSAAASAIWASGCAAAMAQEAPGGDAAVDTAGGAAETGPDTSTGAGEAAFADGDIVVTARRTNESLQKVPVAVTVLSNDLLQNNNIVDGYGILAQLPAVQNITRGVGQGTTSVLMRIRGVSPVAYYFNDVPITNNEFGTFAPFFDLSNVQVLKGPQGTLFGQASNAGAILNTPRKPGEVFAGNVKASVGNFNHKAIEGGLDIPLVRDKLFLRVAGIASSNDGYLKDILTDISVGGNQDYEVGRATLVFRPSDAIENTTLFQAQYIHNLAGGSSAAPGDYNMLDNALNRSIAAVNGMTLQQLLAARDRILANQELIGPYRIQGWSVGCPASALGPATTSTVPGPNVEAVVPQNCAPGRGWIHSYALHNTTTIDLGGGFSIKNTIATSWGRQKFQALYDNDGTRLIGNEANPKNVSISNPLARTITEELQLRGEIGSNFDFVLGGFYNVEKMLPDSPTWAAFTTSLTQSLSSLHTRSRSYAVYGQANYDLDGIIPGLRLTAGGRQTWDAAFRLQKVYNPTTGALVSTNGGPNTASGEAHWSSASYTLVAQYQIDPDTMVYINNSKSSSFGGLQNNARAPKFDPDTLNNLEVGLKTTLRTGDATVRVNAAAYYGWWKNVKVGTVQLLPATPGSSSLILTPTTANAAAARIKGFELEVGGSIGDLFDFNTYASYADPHYTRFDFVNSLTLQPVDLKDQPIQLTPKWKLGATATFHLPVDRDTIGDISFGVSATYRTKIWVNPVKPIIPNDPTNPDTGAICSVPRTAQWGYGPLSADGKTAYKDCAPSLYNVNLNVNWDDALGNEGLRLGLTVTNVTKNGRPAGLNSQYDTLNAVAYQPNEPRTFIATIGYEF